MTLDLPPFLTPSPEQEALELGLDHLIFSPLEVDETKREEANDEKTPPLRAYALLDASQSSDIPICLEGFSNPARCLFDGEAFENLAEVAPWLVELTRHSDVWDWLIEEGYGRNWGIIIHSRLELPRLKTQLKKLLSIEDEDNEEYYFKYYRPQHFNNYAPEFDEVLCNLFWRGVEAVYAEDQSALSIIYRHTVDEAGNHSYQPVDIIDIGKPLIIQPASPDDAQALIEAVKGKA